MAFRPTKACLGLFSRRLPASVRAATQQHNLNPAIVQRVRFRGHPWSYRQRVTALAFSSVLLVSLYRSLKVIDEDEEYDEDEEEQEQDGLSIEIRRGTRKFDERSYSRYDDRLGNGGAESEGEDEEEEGWLFIPFPFTTRQMPLEPYYEGSPEVEAFRKFSKDKEKITLIKKNLAKEVALNHVRMHPELGHLTAVGHRFQWEAPRFAPPAFEQTGLEFTSSYIALTRKPIDPAVAKVQARMQYPAQIAQSLWVYVKVAVLREVRPLAAKAGIQIGLSAEEKNILKWQIEMQKKKMIEAYRTGNGSSESGRRSDHAIPGADAIQNAQASEESKESSFSQLSERFRIPTAAFLLKRLSLEQPGLPPRGSIRFVGHLELQTQRAKSVWLFVSAWYDPASESIVKEATIVKRNGIMWSPPRADSSGTF